MKAVAMNSLIIGIAIAAVIGWVFAFSGVNPSQLLKVDEASAARLTYGFYSVGNNIPCMEKVADDTLSMNAYVENGRSPVTLVDFTATARNAAISFDALSAFDTSINKSIRIPEGTDTLYNQTIYVRPYSESSDLSLTLDARVLSPENAILAYGLTSPHSNTVVFYKDAAGNYCPEN